MFCCSTRRNPTKNDNWHFWFWYLFWYLFCPKDGRFVTLSGFAFWFAETPIFIVFWGCAFLGQVVKKVFWDKEAKTQKMLKITEKFIIWYLWVCSCFFVSFFSFGGFKGQVGRPDGPPHFALNPPYFCLFLV